MMSGRRPRRARSIPLFGVLFAGLLAGTACTQKMDNEPRWDPFEATPFFDNGMSARPQVPGTLARGHLRVNSAFYTGRNGETLLETFPMPVTRATLARGQERFDIFCSPCHGRLGYGDGIVVDRGFQGPPSYHTDRLRNAPVGHFFDVVTNGFGNMASYASRVPPDDRWAIVSYIRALQLSQHATIDDVPAAARGQLQGAP